MKKTYIYILAFLTGLLPGFFLVFNFMFSDIISYYERGLSFLVVIAAYLILGAAFGFIRHGDAWKRGFYLSLPAIILSLAYSISETGTLLLNLMYAAATAIAATTGASLPARLSKKKKQ